MTRVGSGCRHAWYATARFMKGNGALSIVYTSAVSRVYVLVRSLFVVHGFLDFTHY